MKNEFSLINVSFNRGLPSDGSAFAQFSGPQSLNPFPSDETIKKLEREREAEEERERMLEELRLEEARTRFEHDELCALKAELEGRKRAERKEMELLREELATMQTLYQYR